MGTRWSLSTQLVSPLKDKLSIFLVRGADATDLLATGYASIVNSQLSMEGWTCTSIVIAVRFHFI
jgi:hypothetical protein